MRTFFKNRYRIVLEKGGKMERKQVIESFPYEEHNLNKKKEQFKILQSKLDEILKIITGKERKINTGYGFSQSDGQEKLINITYGINN
jgi:hypothetical protein